MKAKKNIVLFSLFTLILSAPLLQAKPKAVKNMMEMPIIVESAKVVTKNWQPSFHATGSLAAFDGLTLAPEVPGRVTKIYFNSGEYVKSGTPLVQLNDEIIKAELQKAMAQLQLSTADYKRYLELYNQRFISKADLDKTKAALKADLASVKMLQGQLHQLLIKAPFDGKLGLSRISLGDYLSAGEAIVDFQEIDNMEVDFSVPETYLPTLTVGEKVIIHSPALLQKYEGEIEAVNSAVSANTRMLDVRAKIPNKDRRLLPGMFVEITVLIDKPKPVLMIPQTAILYATSGNSVYRIVNEKAVQTPVVLGEKLPDNKVIVKSGLSANDTVILGGQVKLHDGSSVMTQTQIGS